MNIAIIYRRKLYLKRRDAKTLAVTILLGADSLAVTSEIVIKLISGLVGKKIVISSLLLIVFPKPYQNKVFDIKSNILL